MDKKMRAMSMSTHSNFFSSIKQVEKRLKLDQKSEKVTETEIEERNLISESAISPMFLNLEQDQPSGSKNCNNQDSSEAPQGFLSFSQGFPLTNQEPSQKTSLSDQLRIVGEGEDDVDEIELLMQLLGISSEEQRDGFENDDGDCNSCHCEGGFYSKIAGVKGPKCEKEAVRLDGWIKHFMNGSGDGVEKQEPLRLAHLLLGKAAFISEGADGGFGGLEFPSTIQEFLHTDPPSH